MHLINHSISPAEVRAGDTVLIACERRGDVPPYAFAVIVDSVAKHNLGEWYCVEYSYVSYPYGTLHGEKMYREHDVVDIVKLSEEG